MFESATSPDPLYLHVRVLLGMVVGLALTHLLRNFARLIDGPLRSKIYWVHVMWAIFVFVYRLHFWWWEFHLAGTCSGASCCTCS